MIDNNLIYASACQAELKVIREDKSQVEFPRRCKTKLAQDRHMRTCLKGQFSIVFSTIDLELQVIILSL